MTLTTEFELFDTVYFLHDSNIVKGNVRKIEFPSISKWNPNCSSNNIYYGVLTQDKLDFYENGGTQENENEYIYKFASQLGKTNNELLKKLMN